MLSRVIAKNVGDVFFETQCRYIIHTYITVTNIIEPLFMNINKLHDPVLEDLTTDFSATVLI